jgi:3',5'-cyclic AMP phosphodiesterase CpdA
MLLAQISDCHVTAPGGRVADRVDPAPGLRRAVERINAMGPAIELVIGTGDLVNDADPAEYDHLQVILADLVPPFLPLPGNHDSRSELRHRFGGLPAGDDRRPIDHVVELDRVRVVCLDTVIVGRHDGRLTDGQLAWLDAVLAERPDRAVVIAQHHPPVPCGIPAMDRYGLANADGEAEVVARHPHVLGIIAGHFHRSMHRRFAGTVVTCCPSTAVQLALDLEGEHASYSDEPTGFVLHRVADDPAGRVTLASHVVPVTAPSTWTPSWARSD